MFSMSDFSKEFQSTEKSYTLPFKDISLDIVALNPSGILNKQNRVEKLTFLLLTLNLIISFPLTNK